MAMQAESLIAHAQAHQEAGRWSEALQIYSRLTEQEGVPLATVRRNMAGCLLAMGQPQPALDFANRALLSDPAEPGALWIQGKALRALRQAEPAERAYLSLLKALANSPARGLQEQVWLELSELALNEFCDPTASRSWAERISPESNLAHRIDLAQILTSLYDRTDTASELTACAVAYARQHLHTPDLLGGSGTPPRRRAARKKLRIGLVSIHFSVSPVFFLTFASFAQLAARHELVFFSRRSKTDWGNARWREIATQWLDVEGKSALDLAQALRDADLDAAFELSGWMDPEAMQAFSARPAARQFKWAGGQAMTTGLDCFDAYLSDEIQTPQETYGLYTEPLALLKGGYVRYTPPDYLPKPNARRQREIAGIVGNPTKVTPAVLPAIREAVETRGIRAIRLIDRHYAYPRVQQRVAECLEPLGLPLDFFVPPAGPDRHRHFLVAVAALGCVIDTVPHSAGLTALEALHVGTEVICQGKGALFCERHAMSHIAHFGNSQDPGLGPQLEKLIRGNYG